VPQSICRHRQLRRAEQSLPIWRWRNERISSGHLLLLFTVLSPLLSGGAHFKVKARVENLDVVRRGTTCARPPITLHVTPICCRPPEAPLWGGGPLYRALILVVRPMSPSEPKRGTCHSYLRSSRRRSMSAPSSSTAKSVEQTFP
jgi:hypothetical protein